MNEGEIIEAATERKGDFSVNAIILAGEEVGQLNPLALDGSKSMLPLFGRPMLAHRIQQLKACGIQHLWLCLSHHSDQVTDYFGEGSRWGMALHYLVEKGGEATVGSVKTCLEQRTEREEPVLVIQGDACYGCYLQQGLDYHKAQQKDVTILLYRPSQTRDSGLVSLNRRGRMAPVAGQDSLTQRRTALAQTGMMILNPTVLDRVPYETPWRGVGDALPQWLQKGVTLGQCVIEGQGRTLRDCPSYLHMMCDGLEGKLNLNMGLPQQSPGIWSAEPFPEDVILVPPCWIGAGVQLGKGCLIGPHVTLEQGVTVAKRGLVQRSYLCEGSVVEEGATLYGVILDRCAKASAQSVLNEGVVLGREAVAEPKAILTEGVKLWPGQHDFGTPIPKRRGEAPLTFGIDGVIQGRLGVDFTPEQLMATGKLLGQQSAVAVGWSGGEEAGLTARILACGIASVGGDVLLHDGSCPAMSAWLGQKYATYALFVEEGEAGFFIHLYDRSGLAVSGQVQRKPWKKEEQSQEMTRQEGRRVGRWEEISGIPKAYIQSATKGCQLSSPLAVVVTGEQSQSLSQALEEIGCVVLRNQVTGLPRFSLSEGGLGLRAWEEEGSELPPDRILSLLALLTLEEENTLDVPASGPVQLGEVARKRGGTLFRVERDGEKAIQCYANQPWMRDGIFAACRICARLGRTGERLHRLNRRHDIWAV